MFDLCPYNTFGLHVQATKGRLISCIDDLKTADADHCIIIGRGSDVLFTDDYEGTALINDIRDLNITQDGDEYIVEAGGGLVLDDLILDLLKTGICGLENLSAIPGTVGAAPVQNIGAYGVEIGSLIEKVECYDLRRHCVESFSAADCQFGYRTSYFKTHPERKLFITKVVFRLHSIFKPVLTYKGLNGVNLEDALEVRERVIALRREKLPDPNDIGNAGCFFKNPIVTTEFAEKLAQSYEQMPVYQAADNMCKLAAGWLIDRSGCRGLCHGNVGTWNNQALVIVNYGNARPHEIVSLAKYIQSEVAMKFGVDLEPEVRIFGRQGEITWEKLWFLRF